MPELFCRLPFRKTEATTDWRVVQKYVQKNFSKINVTPTLERMNELRKQLIQATSGKGPNVENPEAIVETVVKPYVTLVSRAQAHLPISGGEIPKLEFAWRDIWDESHKRTSKNSNTELASCLLNLAALYTAQGAQQAATLTVEGIKVAFQAYQQAAGLYSLVLSFPGKRISAQDVIGDFSTPSLTFLQEFCLAQAHHCSYLKAERELAGKNVLLSKIGMEAAKLYAGVEAAARAIGLYPNNNFLCDYASIAHKLFIARAHFYLGVEAQGKEEIGLALGRFIAASDVAKDARPNFTSLAKQALESWIGEVRAHISSSQRSAQNQNETVYFAKVDRNVSLPEGLGKSMGKAIPMGHMLLPTPEGGGATPDPFKSIFPPNIKNIADVFRAQVQERVLDCSATLQSHRLRIRQCLSELGVECLIETCSQEETGGSTTGRVPDSLRRRIQTLRKDKTPVSGAGKKLIDVLINMLQNISNTRDVVATSIQDIERVLNTEAAEDVKCRAQFGEKIWGSLRQPSHALPDAISLRKFVSEATSTLGRGVAGQLEEIKTRINERLKDLSRLDWPMGDLDSIMPYAKSAGAIQHSNQTLAEVEKLKNILERVDAAETEETQAMNTLQQSLRNCEIEEALCGSPPDQHDEILKPAEEEFNSQIREIHARMKEMDSALEEAQEIMLKIAQGRSKDPVEEEAQVVVNGLEGACSTYESIFAQLTDLSMVAASLADRSESMLSISQSFAASRTLEADDFKRNLEAEIATKAKEVAVKRAKDEDSAQSKARQEELQRQIRELEAMQAAQSTRAGGQPYSHSQQPQPHSQQPQPQPQPGAINDLPPPYTPPQSNSVPAGAWQPAAPPPLSSQFGPSPAPGYGPPTGGPSGGGQQQQQQQFQQHPQPMYGYQQYAPQFAQPQPQWGQQPQQSTMPSPPTGTMHLHWQQPQQQQQFQQPQYQGNALPFQPPR